MDNDAQLRLWQISPALQLSVEALALIGDVNQKEKITKFNLTIDCYHAMI